MRTRTTLAAAVLLAGGVLIGPPTSGEPAGSGRAQDNSPAACAARVRHREEKAPASDDPVLTGLRYRLVGPFRGGRSAAVTGVPGKPQLFYFGSTGGGVWRTTDGGSAWENISDGFFGGSIGAVAVSESDPNVIYVGGGEKTVRGNVSHGDGVWKSTDAGKTWKHVGLGDTRHIPRIRIHPKDPETVYAAALGHLYGPNKERGVFKQHRRRQDVEAGAVRERRSRRRGPDPRSEQPAHPLREHLAREADAVQPRKRRAGVRVCGRAPTAATPGRRSRSRRACRRARSASSASRSRR